MQSNGIHLRAVRCLLLLLLTATALLCQAEPLPAGKGSFQFTDTKVSPGKTLTVWYYAPAGLRPDSKVIFIMHGTDRNAEDYLDAWVAYAEKYGFLAVAPQFSRQEFPQADYQFGGLRHSDRRQWTFPIIEHLFDEVRGRESLATSRYYLYGHSAGAQFVHRFMLFMPDPRVELAIAANAGAYTLPVYPSGADAGFPWRLDQSLVSEEQLKNVFSRRLVVLLGGNDVNPNHKYLSHKPEAEAQGPYRLARGEFFFQTAQQQAGKIGVPFNWTMSVVPGVGHNNKRMSEAAVKYVEVGEK
ncbi:hypothetical protein [Ottowia sp. VDI28]|uniref:hypothetical protein n=1 Tax=Ottowia sp. VDI28 TaxID=3133968 RepID=UPI003C2D3EE5